MAPPREDSNELRLDHAPAQHADITILMSACSLQVPSPNRENGVVLHGWEKDVHLAIKHVHHQAAGPTPRSRARFERTTTVPGSR